MAAFGSGLSAQIGYALESTADTPVTVTQFIPLISETLGQDRGRVESKGIIAGRAILDSGMWNGGNIAAGGDVQHELYNKGLGKLFTGMFGTVASTTGPVSSLYTHTWTGITDPKPLTVQKGVPATSTTVYPMTYAGAMVDSWEIKASAGEIVTFGATLAATREIGYRTVADGVTTSGSPTVTSATAAFVQDDIGKPISGTGIPAASYIGVVNSASSVGLSSTAATNTPVNASASGTSVTFTMGIALASASYLSGLKPFKYNHGSVSLGGTSLDVKQITLSGKTGLDMERYFIGSRYRQVPLKAGLAEITGSMDIEFRDRTQYNRYIAEGTHALVLAFTNYAGESVTFTTNVRIDGETPKVSGTEIITSSVGFKMTDTTDSGAFSVVVKSTDATP